MAREGAPEGTYVTARRQLKGRGRRGRRWFDAPGDSVLLSIIIRPTAPRELFSQLSLVVSLAVAEFVRARYRVEALVKWPNDVLVGGRKIAGILAEVEPTTSAVIVGIGLNVNQRDLPPDIAQRATSIAMLTGDRYDVAEAAEELARAVLAGYERHMALGFEDIRALWRKYMWGAGQWAEVHSEGRAVTGKITGIDNAGALVLRDPSGQEHAIHAADAVNLLTDNQEAT